MINYINTSYKFYIESDKSNDENGDIFEVDLIKDKYYKFKLKNGGDVEGFVDNVTKNIGSKIVIITLFNTDKTMQTQIQSDQVSFFEPA